VSNLRVRDLMTSDVFVARPEDSLHKLRDLMSEKRIRHVPVVDEDGSLVGLVSDRDVLRRAFGPDIDLPLSVQDEVLLAVKVRDIMTWDVQTIEVDEEAAIAAQVMLDNKYGCLPVVEEGVLVGILTEADFVRFVAARNDAPVAGRRTGRQPLRQSDASPENRKLL
jgi:CBS domain-containing membrane protein